MCEGELYRQLCRTFSSDVKMKSNVIEIPGGVELFVLLRNSKFQ